MIDLTTYFLFFRKKFTRVAEFVDMCDINLYMEIIKFFVHLSTSLGEEKLNTTW